MMNSDHLRSVIFESKLITKKKINYCKINITNVFINKLNEKINRFMLKISNSL